MPAERLPPAEIGQGTGVCALTAAQYCSEGLKLSDDASALTGRQQGAMGLLEGAGSGLSAFWDKHWSHTDITGAPSSQKQGHAASLGEAGVVASSSDAGHLSSAAQQQQIAYPETQVTVNLSVSHHGSEGPCAEQYSQAYVQVRLVISNSASESQDEVLTSRKAGAPPAKPAGFAPAARLASLGGFIRSQPWIGAQNSDQPVSQAHVDASKDMGSAAPQPPQEANAALHAGSATREHTSGSSRVQVDILPQDGNADGRDEHASHCRVTLRVPSTAEQSRAADSHAAPLPSRLHSLSGLFRASKPPRDPTAAQPSKSQQASQEQAAVTGDTEESAGAAMSGSAAAEQQHQASVPSAAVSGQQRARWAIPGSGAVSSLYGMVHHAAEAPLAHAGRAVGSLPGLRPRAGPLQDSKAEEDSVAELVMRIKTAASAVLEVCPPWSIPGHRIHHLPV